MIYEIVVPYKTSTTTQMYRYYRCMPVYQHGAAVANVPAGQMVSMQNPNGTHSNMAGGGNISATPGSIIGFASFQELTILELASHQGNVLGYRDYRGGASAGTDEGFDWVKSGGTWNQSMSTNNGDKGIYNMSAFYNWEKYLKTDENARFSVSMGILADIAGGTVDGITATPDDCIKSTGGYSYAANSRGVGVDTQQTVLNGAFLHRDNTASRLNRTTWIGCHPSIHWSRAAIPAAAVGDLQHSNFAILARLLRKYNTISNPTGVPPVSRNPIDYTPGWGGGTDGSPAAVGVDWNGTTSNQPVRIPSILNKEGGAINVPDTAVAHGAGSANIEVSINQNVRTTLGGSQRGYSLAGTPGAAGGDKLHNIAGYRTTVSGGTNARDYYITVAGANAPDATNLRLPGAAAAAGLVGAGRAFLFL